MSDERGIEREGSRGEPPQHRGDRTLDSGVDQKKARPPVHPARTGDAVDAKSKDALADACRSLVVQPETTSSAAQGPTPFDFGRTRPTYAQGERKAGVLGTGNSGQTSQSDVYVHALEAEKLARLAAASVIGREHVRLSRNNQDAAATNTALGFSVAVVCDGCSAGSASEVGAKIAARFLAHTVPSLASTNGLNAGLAEHAADALLAHLKVVIGEQPLLDIVSSQLLFTFLCAVTDGAKTLVFGIGDGVVWVDGAAHVIDSGPENAPPYLTYRLVPGLARAEVAIHHFGLAARVCLATDGLIPALGEIASLFEDEVVWRNPAQLQRRLNVLATRKDPRLGDDATLALLELVPR